ncbi:MAG: GTP cyclohydrolase II [Euryarchaeota archaeon]|nr:GTP cyclohydrolase II [Euryarchaeota archaeon]
MAFGCPVIGEEHVALYLGQLNNAKDLLVRIHSECLTGDALGSKRCDCGPQLRLAMRRIRREGRGLILYMSQEGRGIGIVNKIRAYELQDMGADTVEANRLLGFAADLRDYSCAACFLRSKGVKSVRLMSNNPAKVGELEKHGVKVSKRIGIRARSNKENRGYLRTKKGRMGHSL